MAVGHFGVHGEREALVLAGPGDGEIFRSVPHAGIRLEEGQGLRVMDDRGDSLLGEVFHERIAPGTLYGVHMEDVCGIRAYGGVFDEVQVLSGPSLFCFLRNQVYLYLASLYQGEKVALLVC